MISNFIWHVISTSVVTTALLSIVIYFIKTTFTERLKHEYSLKLKKLEDELKNKTETELAKLNNRLSMETELAKIKSGPYLERQFIIYNELWSSLCELKWSMLQLWSEASIENLSNFSKQLFEAHVKLEKSALIFEEDHYIKLMKILNIFVDYELGKQTLIEYRKKRTSPPGTWEIEDMIQNNREVKNNLLKIIPDIRNILREQIGSSKNAEQHAQQ